jgi:hypothetical protein
MHLLVLPNAHSNSKTPGWAIICQQQFVGHELHVSLRSRVVDGHRTENYKLRLGACLRWYALSISIDADSRR